MEVDLGWDIQSIESHDAMPGPHTDTEDSSARSLSLLVAPTKRRTRERWPAAFEHHGLQHLDRALDKPLPSSRRGWRARLSVSGGLA